MRFQPLANDTFLRACLRQATEYTPVWLMRQAGRYLPEYKATRARAGSFMGLATNVQYATEVTLQPLDRFALDAAILFSDILTIPHAMKLGLDFEAGEGPRIERPVRTAADIERLPIPDPEVELRYVTDAVRMVRRELDGRVPLIGFAGSPWTVATYMTAGQGSRDQAEARTLAYRDPGQFADIVERIAAVTFDYLSGQAAAGAEALQLFDSWSGSLAPAEFERWVIAPTARLVERLRAEYPDVPVIGFPKGAGGKLGAYARETKVGAIGLDETVDPLWAAKELPRRLPVQGNLDPLALRAGGEALYSATQRILDAFAERPHIFNLGHGILPDTPIAHVEELIARVKGGE